METHKTILLAILIVLVLVLLGIFIIPQYRKRKKKSKVILEFTDVDEQELGDLYIGIIPDVEMRRKINAYNQIFLTDQSYKEKNQVYISKEVYDRIKQLVPLIAPNLSCSTFISNILGQHLEEYQMVLRVLYEINFKNTLKSWNTTSNSASQ